MPSPPYQRAMVRTPRSLLMILALATSLAACGGKKDSPKKDSDSDSESSAAKPKSSSAAALPVGELPKDVDNAVVEELKKIATCPREDGYRKSDCEAYDAWDKYRDKYYEEDDLNQTKQKKLSKACFSMVGDKNDNIRESAFDCLAYNSSAIDDPKAVIAYILSKLEGETVDPIRSSMLSALDYIDPTKHGGTDQVLALAKKFAPRDDISFVVAKLIDALTPQDREGEPPADAFAFAVEQIGKGKHQHSSASLLASTKSKKPEACKALIGLVETKKYPWGYGMYSMASLGDACKEHYDKLVAVVVEKAGEPDSYDKGFSASDAIYLEQLLGKGGFTAEQKTKLSTAVEPLVKSAKNESAQKTYQSLVDALKK